jgi:amino acid permease
MFGMATFFLCKWIDKATYLIICTGEDYPDNYTWIAQLSATWTTLVWSCLVYSNLSFLKKQ